MSSSARWRIIPATATVVIALTCSAIPFSQAAEIDCHSLTAGCTNLPEGHPGLPADATQEQQAAWSKCLASIVITGVPAAQAVSTLRNALAVGAGASGLAAYSQCDWDAIRGV